jgi:ketosteroid isomerase-like protein
MTRDGTALELATRYRDAFFARDLEAIIALVTPDFVFENVTGGERIEGADAARRPPPHRRHPRPVARHDVRGTRGGPHRMCRSCRRRMDARATHPDSGQRIEWDGLDVIQVRHGRICRNAVYSSAHVARTLEP